MKALLKLLAVLFVAFALLSALFAAWVTWSFDLDDYRDEVAALIARETGLEVEIDGPLRYHLLRGLHLSVEGLNARRDGFEVLVVERLEVSISLFRQRHHRGDGQGGPGAGPQIHCDHRLLQVPDRGPWPR